MLAVTYYAVSVASRIIGLLAAVPDPAEIAMHHTAHRLEIKNRGSFYSQMS